MEKNYLNYLIWLIILPINLFGPALSDTGYTDCPPVNLLLPCSCTNLTKVIECSSGFFHGNTLRYIFFDAYLNLSKTNQDKNDHLTNHFKPKFHHLKIIHSPLEQILNNSFSDFIFQKITIENNYHLIGLELNAFDGTEQETIELNFKSNINLFSRNSSVENFFSIIFEFINLQSLTIDHCGLTYLPIRSFQMNQLNYLKKLTIINNPIEIINLNILGQIPSIRIIDFSNNKIHSLKQSTFWLNHNKKECKESFKREDIHYFVDLSGNNITEYSFVNQSFNISCTMELNLTKNNIQFLNETIFRPLFKHYTRIILLDNPLNCNDCRMDWLLKGRYCQTTNRLIRYFTAIDSKCENMDYLNFILKCEPYSSRLKSLTIPLNSPSNYLINQYIEYFPNDFMELDDQLFRCSYNNSSTISTSFLDNFIAKLKTMAVMIKNFFK